MGKHKKSYNWKARQQAEVKIDNSEVKNIQLSSELKASAPVEDDANILVLPSAKRVTKKVKDKSQSQRILSHKQRKRLEKIIEKKKKKAQSAEIIQDLGELQVSDEIMNQLISIADARTMGRKRKKIKENHPELLPSDMTNEEVINSIGRSKKQRRMLSAILKKDENFAHRTDVLGFEPAASSSEDEEEPSVPNPSQDEIIEINLKETNETNVVTDEVKKENSEAKVEERKQPPVVANARKTVWVPVTRDVKIQEARLKLPILAEEQMITEVINENDVVIIAGETGSGKTTQIPQFLYESGYAENGKIIGITQPRRVAAISMSQRVAQEMNLTQNEVSYLIRFEGNVTGETKIKFMTDGVLLKEIQSDFLLSKYSIIVLDEAHERNSYTDILIGLLSRIVPLRNKKDLPLKLIIMSATLRIEDFTENTRLFKKSPPVVKIDSRQYPVTIHFSKTTPKDYLSEAFKKTCRIHETLPEGGILVFVTGQQEVNTLVRKLRKRFPLQTQLNSLDPAEEDFINRKKDKGNRRKPKPILLPHIDLDKYSVVPTDDAECEQLETIAADDSDDSDDDRLGASLSTGEPLYVLPFYSLLPKAKQARVFEPPPPHSRLCVVATNVAETSLTIPKVKYVVDTGKTKTRLYDKLTGVSTFDITWCSKAAANQRAGRAGRTAHGHCYRLYSSAVFNDLFEKFAPPEIQQKPIDALLLQMKAMNIVKVVNFPFPTSPDLLQLVAAEKRLRVLGALEEPPSSKPDEFSSKLTKLGETMAVFPVVPRYAKMLALSVQFDLLQYVLAIVAALSVPEVFLERSGDKQWASLRRAWAGLGNSFLLGDVMVLLRAVGAAECTKEDLETFCRKNGLRHKAIVEIRKLRVQLTNQINMTAPGVNLAVDRNMKPPTDTQARLLRQVILAGMADQVAHKADPSELSDTDGNKKRLKRAYKCSEMEDPVYLKMDSVLNGKNPPEWIVYQEVFESNRLYFRGVTAIEPEWLPIFAPTLCNLSEPLSDPPPRYDPSTGKVQCFINGTFGKSAFPIPTVQIPYTYSIHSYKLFAKFLLLGEVFPKLKRFVPDLLSAPSSLTKPWAKLQPRTEILVNALLSKEANTRQRLLDLWEENSTYLLSAYQSWLPESAHRELVLCWPPI